MSVVRGVRYTDEDCGGCGGTGRMKLSGGVFSPGEEVECRWCGGVGKRPVRAWNWQLGPHPEEVGG